MSVCIPVAQSDQHRLKYFSAGIKIKASVIVTCFIASFVSTLQLGTVSLALFRTLIGLYCEDVMLQLILR